RRIATDEALDEQTAGSAPGALGQPVRSFELVGSDDRAVGAVELTDLVASSGVVIVVLGTKEDREREAMVHELADGLRESPCRLVVIAPRGSAAGRRLAASRTARVLEDPTRSGHRALGIPMHGPRRRSSGG